LSDTDPKARQEKANQQILDKIQNLGDKLKESLIYFQKIQMEHGMMLSKITNELGLEELNILAIQNST
jgi:hypothetical protein